MARIPFGFIFIACGIGVISFTEECESAPVPKGETTPYVRWTVKADPESRMMHSGIVIKDSVVVSSENGDVLAYLISDGKLKWSRDCGRRGLQPPTMDGTNLYVSSEKGLTALNADTGKMEWFCEIEKADGPVFALEKNSRVYTADDNGSLHCIDVKTGKRLWSADFLADAPPDPPTFDGARARRAGNSKARPSNITGDGETVYLTVFDQCRVVAFDAASGKSKWSFQTKGWVGGSALVTATSVFLGSQDTNFYCLDKKSGKETWKVAAKGRTDGGCAVDGENVFFGTSAGIFYCLNQKTGKEIWQFQSDPRSDGQKYSTGSRPILLNSALWFASHDGKFYGVNASSGQRLAMIQPDEQSDLAHYLITDGKSIYFTTRPHYVRQGVETGGYALVAISFK